MNLKSGVYQIMNTANGHSYIGSSQDIDRRWGEHRRSLMAKTGASQYLQRAWNKHGSDSFEFTIICQCPIPCLLGIEQYWIDRLKPQYNMAPFAGAPNRGRRPSPESIAKHSAAMKGFRHSEESRKKMSEVQTGKVFSEEHRKNIGKSKIGVHPSDETRLKLSKAKKGVPKSEHWKLAMSVNRKGRFGGDNGCRHKLEWEQVREIRKIRAEKNTSYDKLGEIYHVSGCTIRAIVKGKSWVERD